MRNKSQLGYLYLEMLFLLTMNFGFYRNAINIGWLLVECEQADEIRHGDVLEIDTQKGVIRNITPGR